MDFFIAAGSLCAVSPDSQLSLTVNRGNQPIPKAIDPGKLPSDTDTLSGIGYLCAALIISYLARIYMELSVFRFKEKHHAKLFLYASETGNIHQGMNFTDSSKTVPYFSKDIPKKYFSQKLNKPVGEDHAIRKHA